MPQVRLAVCARMVGFAFAAALLLAVPALAGTTPTGGSGLGSSPAKAKAKAKKSKKKSASKKNAVSADPTAILSSDPVLAPVKQDGGSQHLGERMLKQGMHGHDVRVLQSYLTLAGFPATVDGDFGPGTKASVVAFEKASALTANGVLTYAQSRVLRGAVAKAMASGPPVNKVSAVTNSGPVGKTTINSNGTATAPAGAPVIVQKVVAAANQIIDKPYIYAGGHASWNAPGYDCSGSVSYALHGGGLLSSPEDSTGLESYGSPGPGKWITIYADSAHTFIVVAGRAFDTADFGGPNIPAGTGPRWRSNPTGNLADGGDYIVRHPAGL